MCITGSASSVWTTNMNIYCGSSLCVIKWRVKTVQSDQAMPAREGLRVLAYDYGYRVHMQPGPDKYTAHSSHAAHREGI